MNRYLSGLALLLVFMCSFTQAQPKANIPTAGFEGSDIAKLLVFTKTVGYRHSSIEKGVSTLKLLGTKHSFEITHSEDAGIFSQDSLSEFDVIIFLSTTMDILNTQQEEAFKNYINKGGSFMGIHAATDTEYDWPWYGKLVGAYFESHPNNPNVRKAVMKNNDREHPATSHLNDSWVRTDEWYNFKNINPGIKVLLTLDETSYQGGTNGDFHPIAWYHEFDGGRSFYTGGGHTEASFDEPDFQQHILGGIQYCLDNN